MTLDWIQLGILIVTILVPVCGGLLHIVNILMTMKYDIRSLKQSHAKTRKTVVRLDRQVSHIEGKLGIESVVHRRRKLKLPPDITPE